MTKTFINEPDRELIDIMNYCESSVGSRFRPRYRALTDDEKALHDEIKGKAAELEALFDRVSGSRYSSLAMTSLEESVMWIVKGLTS